MSSAERDGGAGDRSHRLTSAASDRVKSVRALHSRQGRRKAGRFVVEGPQGVRSALAAGVAVHEIFVADDAGDVFPDVLAAAAQARIRVTPAAPPALAAMAETEQSQGLIAVCDLLPAPDLVAVMAAPGPVVVLEALTDPGNVGTVIRTSDAAGAAGVVLTPGSADVHNGKVVRSTAGSLFHLPLCTGIDLAEAVVAARSSGRTVAVATGDADDDLFAAVRAGRVGPRTCWVVGSEAHGVSQEARSLADLGIRIPMDGRTESLNAAVAAAVVLFVTSYGA